jgi:uncharacterized protein Yka (UPF0111/DUF47 family)
VKIEIQDSLSPLIKAITEQLDLFAQKSHGSLTKNLEEFDEALTGATTQLNQSVKEMNKHLNQVENILEKNSKVA